MRAILGPMRFAVAVLVVAGCLSKPDRPADNDDAGDATSPHVFSSPGPAAAIYNSSYAEPFSITLAADDPATMIYYTTDGSVPGLASTHAMTPITGIQVSSSLVISYFGSNGSASTIVTETFSVATSSQVAAGYMVTNTNLTGTSPVVFAAPGQTFNASADIQVWVQSSCASCSAQLVYGVDTTDQGCLFDGTPGVYPGNTQNTKAFAVTAPTTPGVYEVRVAHIEELSCSIAMSRMALATRPTLARIGVLVVR